MTDLAEVAASVAKALELVPSVDPSYLWEKDPSSRWNAVGFFANGSNLTDPYWIWRCVEWLLAHGCDVWLTSIRPPELEGMGRAFWLDCPVAEFPARAIHELMKERK